MTKKKVVPLVGTTKTKLDGVNQEGFKVKGQVSDNVGPLPGVNVMVKGTMTGVITDMDGNFEIVAPYSKSNFSLFVCGISTQRSFTERRTNCKCQNG